MQPSVGTGRSKLANHSKGTGQSCENTARMFSAEWSIEPQPSRLLLGFIAITHLIALGIIAGLPEITDGSWQAWAWSAGLSILVIWSLFYYGRLYSGRRPEHWVETLYWRESGGWELTTATGEHLPVIFSDSSFNSRLLSVLNFKTRAALSNNQLKRYLGRRWQWLGGRRFTVILLPDNSRPAQRRHLRMRMKLYAQI